MITIKKTEGVRSSDPITCARIQELIAIRRRDMPIGKVVIDEEKLTFYKFGLKVSIARYISNGILYTDGNLSYYGISMPQITDKTLFHQLMVLFNLE